MNFRLQLHECLKSPTINFWRIKMSFHSMSYRKAEGRVLRNRTKGWRLIIDFLAPFVARWSSSSKHLLFANLTWSNRNSVSILFHKERSDKFLWRWSLKTCHDAKCRYDCRILETTMNLCRQILQPDSLIKICTCKPICKIMCMSLSVLCSVLRSSWEQKSREKQT